MYQLKTIAASNHNRIQAVSLSIFEPVFTKHISRRKEIKVICNGIKYTKRITVISSFFSGQNRYLRHINTNTMESDDIINKALSAGGGGMLHPANLFVLEGNVERNMFQIKTLEQAYIDNYSSFVYEIKHNFIMIGIFNSEETAEEFIMMIRTLSRDEEGNRIK